jgi:type 2 lantibiotic biosynthesis protein LanM
MSSSTALYEDPDVREARRTPAELLASPRWSLAETLAERLAGRRPASVIDRVAGEKRLARWKAQSAFAKNPGLWEQRLAAQGITEEELLEACSVGVPPASADSRPEAHTTPWLSVIAEVYGDGGRTPAFAWPERTDLQRCPFLPLVEPLVRHYCDRLPEGARILTAHLPDHFAPMLNRTLLVEMHALKLEGLLEGDTPEARFADFVEKLRDRTYALEILELYPVLARQLVQRLELWSEACAELLQRLTADEATIAAELHDGKPIGTLIDVYGALSDFHRRGRSVFILVFDSGFEVVYKPKPLAIEARFQELLGWLNARGFEPAFKQTRVIDRGEYGWMEMVQTARCPDDAALQRFLERQGGYLALLYALDGTDFHHENLLAAGEHPVLIDLETLFQPWLNVADLRDAEHAPAAPLRSTVLRSNMLPERWWGGADAAGVDLSGLTAGEGQLTPRPMPAVTDTGRDTMRIERRRLTMPVGENRARVAGREVTATEFAVPLETGFRRLYALLLENRDGFAKQLETFAGAEMRLLFRNTMHYGTVWLESFHPHALGNAVDRDRLFDGLWAFVPRRPFLASLAALEVEELHRGDIPLFYTYADSRQVWSAAAKPPLSIQFAESGLDRARKKLNHLSPADCERQVAVIRDTFTALRLAGGQVARPTHTLTPANRPSSDELLALAREAGDRLVLRAFTNEREAHWLALDHRDANGWQVTSCGPDVYLGLSGVAFFLGYLGAATGDARYTGVARKALFAQKRQLASDPSAIRGIGAFNGWGGIIYTLAHLGRLWRDDELLDEAEEYARKLPALIETDEMLDVVVGSAGAFFSLAALAETRPSAWLDALLLQCGERLLAMAAPQQRGHGWPMPLAGNRALAGMSHGAAGIALALLRLYGRTGDARFRDAALGGIEYERSLFSESEQNWPDLRVDAAPGADGGDGRHFMLAWCHGAPGIGLARIAGLPWLDDEHVRREIDVAVRSTLAGGFRENHSLCHGDLGNVELLFAAARANGDEDLEEKAWNLTGGIVQSIRSDGWLFGLPGNIETPGLMAGLAGIGFGLGRLARPDVFPDLLTVES